MEVESQPVKPARSQTDSMPAPHDDHGNASTSIALAGTESVATAKSDTGAANLKSEKTCEQLKPEDNTTNTPTQTVTDDAADGSNKDSDNSVDGSDQVDKVAEYSKDVSIKTDAGESTQKSDSKGIKNVTDRSPMDIDADGDVTMKSADISDKAHIAMDSKKDVSQTTHTVDTNMSPSTQSQSPPLFATAISHKVGQQSIAAAMSAAASVVVAAAGLSTAIPENILSPPKSETQTDDTNTATSSSSPGSDSQLSPLAAVTATSINTATAMAITSPTPEVSASTGAAKGSPKNIDAESASLTCVPQSTATTASATVLDIAGSGGGGGGGGSGRRVVQPINVVANGTIPKSSGKPQMSAMNKKLNKSTRTPRQRKAKTTVPIYESEISNNKTGIKLCIKKSDSSGNLAGTAGAITPPASTPSSKVTPVAAAVTAKQPRKRSRKSKSKARVDSDDSEYEIKRKKERGSNNTERQKKVSFTGVASEEQEEKHRAAIEQGDWGARMPQEILYKIFEILVDREGCLPTLCRLGRVCSLWRNVSLTPTLWKSLDLTTWMKDKYRTELKLKWFVDNRCSECTELNVANWKVSDISCFLAKLANGCPNLTSITLSGWKDFTSDHLAYLTENMQKLERLDLSSVNVEMNASKTAVGLQSLCNALQAMNDRLTHLYLAHNRLAGIPQIVTTLSTHCPNIAILDFSNVTTQATSHGILHIEKLQHGCSKLKVLRVTNSHVTLSTASMQEMMDSPGFPDLEELSVAALTDESRVIGDEHLQRILKTSSKLKLLDVRGCTRLTHESLIRLPAWDIKHLFLSGCSVTRDVGSGLELIASKWAHSLIELDLAWANVQQPLDNALRALAEKGSESPLAHLNLCGSSVSDEAVKEILANCAHMSSINLSSCRGLPRGVKRLMQGPQELQELRDVLKVQMKVKLPSQLKQEQEEQARREQEAKMKSAGDGDGDGGGGVGVGCVSGSSQSN